MRNAIAFFAPVLLLSCLGIAQTSPYRTTTSHSHLAAGQMSEAPSARTAAPTMTCAKLPDVA